RLATVPGGRATLPSPAAPPGTSGARITPRAADPVLVGACEREDGQEAGDRGGLHLLIWILPRSTASTAASRRLSESFFFGGPLPPSCGPRRARWRRPACGSSPWGDG